MIKKNSGLKFNIRKNEKSDWIIIQEVLIKKDYTQNNFKVRKNDVVIDIGAHIGAFSIFAAKTAKNGNVYSYEPFPENFRLLQENCRLNKVKNVRLFRLAVAGSKKRAPLFIGEKKYANGLFRRSKSDKKIIVNCTTITEIFENNQINTCNFLKIDCEGGEYEILLNTPEDYLHKIEKIAFEYHDSLTKKRLLKKLIKYLGGAGFKLRIIQVVGTRGIIYAENKHPKTFSGSLSIKISNSLAALKVFKFPKNYLLRADRAIGNIGIFIKKLNPRLYFILRSPVALIKLVIKADSSM